MGTLPRDWDRCHLLLRQGAESCIFLSFHGNDEAPYDEALFWETWLPSLFEESKIAMGHGETLNHAACSSSNPDPQLLHGFKRHAGSTLLRALFVLTNLDITQKMKRLLASKYVTSDKWCNLCFATTNGILTCQHGLLLDLSGILVASSPPPQRASRPNLQVGTLGKHSVKPWDNVGSGWIKFHLYRLYCKQNWWNPEMLGQCLRSFQSIHQQSAERNPWRDVSTFQPDWTWNTSHWGACGRLTVDW